MATETLTHFKKNLDPRYISGEDLKYGETLGHGLRPEMVVTISHFEDKETYDQQKKAKSIKTGLFLKEYPSGKAVYKPVILNNTNAKFFAKLTGSPYMEKWINIPVVLWAQPDTRFEFVARFKEYFAPSAPNYDADALAKLNACKTQADLTETWSNVLTKEERKMPAVLARKDVLKGELQ